jgi:hypothetical protein
MQSRYFSVEKDYAQVCKWWQAWNWPTVPEIFLPEIGIVVSNHGIDVCAGFLYKTDSAVCWAENYIMSTEVPRELSKGCVDFLIQRLTKEAKELGFKLMMSSVNHPSLIRKLLKAGCSEKYESNMSNLAMVL